MYNISDRFTKAIKGSHRIASKVEVYSPNGDLIKDDFIIKSGNISVDGTVATRRRARLILGDNNGDLVPQAGEVSSVLHPLSSNYVRIYRGIHFGYIEVPEERTRWVEVGGGEEEGLNTGTLYWEGEQVVSWIEGNNDAPIAPSYSRDMYGLGSEVINISVIESSTTSQAIVEFTNDFINMKVYNSISPAQVTVVSDNTIDFTSVNTVYVEGEMSGEGKLAIAISTDKTAGYETNDIVEILPKENLLRQLFPVDVSTLSGSYYIRIHLIDENTLVAEKTEAKIYGIGLDESPGYVKPELVETKFTTYRLEDDIEYVPLGVFDIFDTEISDTRDELNVEVKLFDFSKRIERARLLENYTINAGTNYRTAIIDLIESGVPGLSYDVPVVNFVTPKLVFGSTGDQGGGDRWKYAREMAESIGHELYFSRSGNITMRPVPDVDSQAIVWQYDEADNANILFTTRALTKENTFNVVKARGESTSNSTAVSATAMDENPESATYVGDPPGSSDYGMVPTFLQSNYITTTAQAQEAANARLKQVLGTTEKMRVMVTTNPAFEANDLIRIRRKRSKTNTRYLLDRFNIPLEYNVAMNFTMREMRRSAL